MKPSTIYRTVADMGGLSETERHRLIRAALSGRGDALMVIAAFLRRQPH